VSNGIEVGISIFWQNPDFNIVKMNFSTQQKLISNRWILVPVSNILCIQACPSLIDQFFVEFVVFIDQTSKSNPSSDEAIVTYTSSCFYVFFSFFIRSSIKYISELYVHNLLYQLVAALKLCRINTKKSIEITK